MASKEVKLGAAALAVLLFCGIGLVIYLSTSTTQEAEKDNHFGSTGGGSSILVSEAPTGVSHSPTTSTLEEISTSVAPVISLTTTVTPEQNSMPTTMEPTTSPTSSIPTEENEGRLAQSTQPTTIKLETVTNSDLATGNEKTDGSKTEDIASIPKLIQSDDLNNATEVAGPTEREGPMLA